MEYILYNGELYHHGIKGQKWGVRRFQNEDGTLTSNGKRRYSRMFSSRDTYERIKAIRNTGRMDYMSARQKKSLDNAEQYWKARAEGKKPTVKRGIIKRQADRYRSYPIKARIGQSAALGVIGTVGSTAASTISNGPIAGLIAVHKGITNNVLTTAGNIAISELNNRVFGHF